MPAIPRCAAALAVLLLALVGCKAEPPPPHKVVMVGIDGGDWRILDPFIEAGIAPNLARLRQQGASAPLVIDSAMSPESWTTVATGHRPAQHGVVQDQLGMMGGGFQATNKDVLVHRVWDMATRGGRSSLVLNYWAASPAYPILGVLIPRERGSTWPPGLEGGAPDIPPTHHAELVESLGLGSLDSGRAKELLAKQPFDLAILPYYGFDQGLHILYGEYATARDPEAMAALPPETAARMRLGYEIVEETVRLADGWVGLALQAAGPDGYVVVFSDHGHAASNPSTRRVALGRSVLDGGQGSIENGTVDLSGLGLGAATGAVKTSTRRSDGGELRVPSLRIEGEAAQAVSAHLLTLTTKAGRPLFAGGAGGTLVASPDVVDACRTTLGKHEEPAWSCFVNSGGHGIIDKGIFAVHGPDVVPGPMSVPVESVDITPTVLWLMGLPTALDLAGQPRTEVLSSKREVLTIPTYENGDMPWRQGVQDAPTDDTELMEWLKSMGYME